MTINSVACPSQVGSDRTDWFFTDCFWAARRVRRPKLVRDDPQRELDVLWQLSGIAGLDAGTFAMNDTAKH